MKMKLALPPKSTLLTLSHFSNRHNNLDGTTTSYYPISALPTAPAVTITPTTLN